VCTEFVGVFILWGPPIDNSIIRGKIVRDEYVILLDVIPGVVDIGDDKFQSTTKFYLMTSLGIGYIIVERYVDDGGILTNVKRMLNISC